MYSLHKWTTHNNNNNNNTLTYYELEIPCLFSIVCFGYLLGIQSRQVKCTPLDAINESIIWEMNPLVLATTSIKFKSTLLHV